MLGGYTILELESIPREKALLSAMIIDARRKQWRSNISRFIALNLVIWSFLVLFAWGPLHAAPSQTTLPPHGSGVVVYLPQLANP